MNRKNSLLALVIAASACSSLANSAQPLQFTNLTGSALFPTLTNRLRAVAYDGARKIVAVGERETFVTGTFTNGYPLFLTANWNNGQAPGGRGLTLTAVAAGGGLFVASGDTNLVDISTDGLNWSIDNGSIFANVARVEALAFNGASSSFVAAPSAPQLAFTSSPPPPGGHWTAVTDYTPAISFAESFRGITPFGTDGFAVCGVFADVRISDSSASGTWRKVNGHVGQPDLFAIAAAGTGTIVSVGEQDATKINGVILISTDGSHATWTPVFTNTSLNSSLKGVAYTGSGFIAVGAGGQILCSSDGSVGSWINQTNAAPDNGLALGFRTNLNGVVFATSGDLRGVGALVGDGGTVILAGPRPPPPVSLGDTNVCEGGVNPPLIVSATNSIGADVVTVDWFASASGGSPVAGGVATNTFFPPDSLVGVNNQSNYTYFAEARDLRTGFVSTNRTPVTLTIFPRPRSLVSGSTTICNGDPAPIIQALLTGLAPWTVSWSDGLVQSGITAPVGTTGLVTRTVVNINASDSTPDVRTYTVTNLTDANCIANNADRTGSAVITVNPTPRVDQPASQTVCNGSATTNILFTGTGTSYTWVNDTTSIGLAASGTNDILSFAVSNTGLVPVTATITVTPHFLNNGVDCTGPTKSFVITVNPTPFINQPASQTVCNGGATTNIIFSGNATSFTWVNNTTSIGLAPGGTGDILSFVVTNGGTTPVTATITVTPHFLNLGVDCTGPTKSFIITVNPTPSVNQPASQTVCNGAATTNINFSGNATSFTWVNDTPGIALAASGTGNILSFTVTNGGTAPVTATIVVTPHFLNLGVDCTGPTKSFIITVNPTPTVNQPASQTVCNGGATTNIVFSGNATSFTWVNNTTSIGLLGSGTGDIPSFTVTNGGTTPVTATIVVTPHFLNLGVDCTGPTKAFIITVNPTPSANQPASQTVCNGAATTNINFSGNATSFTWVNDTPGIGLAASGIGNISSFTVSNAGTAPVTATIVVTPHFLNLGVDCTGPAKTFIITVNPTPTVNQPASQTVCNGGATTNILFSGNATSFTWANNTTSIGLAASGTGDILAFTVANAGTTPVTATITVTPHFLNLGVDCTGPTKSFIITVNPTPSVNQAASQTVCNGGATTNINFAGNATSFAWVNNDTTIGLAASGTGNILSFTVTNGGTTPVTATVVVTPHFLNLGVDCTGPTKTFTITVNPTPTVNQPASQTVCNGTATTNIVFSGNATSFTWANNTTSIGLGASGTGNINAFSGVNAGSSPVTATITVTPHFLNLGVDCTGPTKSFTITVNPTPTVNQPASQTVCNGGATTNINFSGTGTSFTWVNNNTTIGLAASGTGDIPAFTVTNGGTTAVAATVTVTPHFLNLGVDCTGPTKSLTITVNPPPSVNQPASQTVCNGAATTNINFSGTGSTSFTWANDTPSIGLAASGTGNILAFTTVNAGASPVTATLTVTPHFLNLGVDCTGPAKSFTITINPTPTVNQPASQGVCFGGATTNIVFSGNATSFTWVNNTTSIGLGASGTGDIPSFTVSNGGTAPVTATITVTPHFLNLGVDCTGPTKNFTIKADAQITAAVSPSIATITTNGQATIQVTLTGSTNYLLQWDDGTNQIATTSTPTRTVFGTNIATIGSFQVFTLTNVIDGVGCSLAPTNNNSTEVDLTDTNVVATVQGGANTSTNFCVSGCLSVSVTVARWSVGKSAVEHDIDVTFSDGSVFNIVTNPSSVTFSKLVCTNASTVFTIASVVGKKENTSSPQTLDPSRIAGSVAISISSPATVNAGPDQGVCASSPTVTLAGFFGGTASSATWSGGTGLFAPNNTTTNATYTPSAGEILAGTVTLTLTTDDPPGACPATNDSMTITISAAATVNAGPPQTVCTNNLPVALAGSFGGAASSATWSGGAGAFSPNATTTNATYSPTAAEIAAGSVTLKLATDDPAGLCGPVTNSVTITLQRPPVILSQPTNVTVCAGSPAAFFVSATGTALTYQWQASGDGGASFTNISATATNASFTNLVTTLADNTNQYQVIVAGTCSPPATSAPPAVLTVNVPAIVSASTNQTVCASVGTNPVSLFGSFGGSASSATWSSSGTGTFTPNNTTTNATYTPTTNDVNSGSVTLTLTTDTPAGPCPAVSASMTITFAACITSAGTVLTNVTSCAGLANPPLIVTFPSGNSANWYLNNVGPAVATHTNLFVQANRTAGTYRYYVYEVNSANVETLRGTATLQLVPCTNPPSIFLSGANPVIRWYGNLRLLSAPSPTSSSWTELTNPTVVGTHYWTNSIPPANRFFRLRN